MLAGECDHDPIKMDSAMVCSECLDTAGLAVDVCKTARDWQRALDDEAAVAARAKFQVALNLWRSATE